MNILIIGPIHREKEFLKQKGKYPFLESQGQQSWVEALEELGHKVFVFRYTDSILFSPLLRTYIREFFQGVAPEWYARYSRLKDTYYYFSLENQLKNKKLLFLANKIKPDVILISGGVSSIFPETSQAIKRLFTCKILLLSGVNPETSSPPAEKNMVKNGTVDVVVENDRGYGDIWKKFGAKKVIVLPISSVDPKLHRRLTLTKEEEKECECDVCFVGTLTKDRQEKLVQLISFNLKVWGDILPTVQLTKPLKPFYCGQAYGEKMVKIFNASKIVLNFQPNDMKFGGNMRTFEILGCGAFQLADKIDTEWFEEGKEYIRFRDIEDLKKKINYYLKHDKDRKKIADTGYRKAYNNHTYKDHFSKLLKMINGKIKS